MREYITENKAKLYIPNYEQLYENQKDSNEPTITRTSVKDNLYLIEWTGRLANTRG